jgi:hypothetical protein
MPNANESPVTGNITLSLFGGLVSDPSPVDLPQGVSPANSDVAFLQGSVGTRAGLSKLYPVGLPADANFAVTYALPDDTPSNLIVAADGNLYQTVSTSVTPTLISAGTASFVPAGSLIRSEAASTREYLTAFNPALPGGAAAPAIWDGANLSRLTVDGPGNAVVAVEQSISVGIVSIVQPAPIGALPGSTPFSMGTTTINFFSNNTGIYKGTGTQTNTAPYTGGTSLVFNPVTPYFPISGFSHCEHRSPMSQIQQDQNGNYIGPDIFFPESARLGADGYGFDANIQSTIAVTTAGTYTLYLLVDDGWTLFVGNALTGGGVPAYISGPRSGPAASSHAGLTSIAYHNQVASDSRGWDTVTLSFSAAGVYPIEIGFSNLSDNTATFLEVTWASGTGPTAGGRSPVGNPLRPIPASGNVVCTQSGSTVTVVCPANHPFGVGDLALVAGMTVAAYDGLQTVLSVPSSYTFTYSLASAGLAIGTGGTVAPVTATCITASAHGLLVTDGVVVGGNSENLYNNAYDDTLHSVVNPGLWNVKAILDPFTFQFDCLQNAGVTGTGGVLSCGGQTAPGIHKCCVFFELEDGSQTKPSPLSQWNSNGNRKVTIYNLPMGPPNTRARCVAFTASAGGNYFYLPTDMMGTQSTLGGISSPALIGTSTRVADNTSMSATFDFSDASLLAATAIDIPGNNLFAQVTLAPCQGVIEYADRLFVWGEYNTVQNFTGMTMSAGVSHSTPPGWVGNGDSSGAQTLGNLQTYRWTITGDGTADGRGFLQQPAYQDSLNVPILLPLQKYRWRAFLQPSTATGTGQMTADFYSTTFGSVMASASVDLTGVTSAGAWCEARMTVATPAAIPADSLLRVFATGIAAGATCSISDLQIIPDDLPVLGTQMRGSYAFNPTAFEAPANLLQIPGNRPITDCFVYHDQLYIATAKSLYYTSDTGPTVSSWAINEVSDRVGSVSPRSSDGGDDRYFLANRTGVYLLSGNNPTLISSEIKATWDRINWAASHLLWLKSDVVERMLYIGLPLDGSTSINNVLTCSFRSVQDDIDPPQPIHITQAGKITATENARKWSLWSIPAACGQILRSGGDDRMTFGVLGKSQLYSLDATKLHDDDATTPIPAYYTTYFFLGPDEEAANNTGSHRKLIQYVTTSAQGTGSLLVTPYVDSLFHNKRPLKRKPLTSGIVTKDIEFPANVLGERTALRFEAVPAAGSLDANFSVRRVVVSVSPDLLTPVGGRV